MFFFLGPASGLMAATPGKQCMTIEQKGGHRVGDSLVPGDGILCV